MTTPFRYPPRSRNGKVTTAVHEAGVAGLTVPEVAERTGLPQYIVKELLSREITRNHVVKVDHRRVGKKLLEVYTCRCSLSHKTPADIAAPPTSPYSPPERLTEHDKASGRAGIAAARAALAETSDRRS